LDCIAVVFLYIKQQIVYKIQVEAAEFTYIMRCVFAIISKDDEHRDFTSVMFPRPSKPRPRRDPQPRDRGKTETFTNQSETRLRPTSVESRPRWDSDYKRWPTKLYKADT